MRLDTMQECLMTLTWLIEGGQIVLTAEAKNAPMLVVLWTTLSITTSGLTAAMRISIKDIMGA